MARFFRKKPVEIEAFCFGVDKTPEWFEGKQHVVTGQWYIVSPEGRMYFSIGDFIIKGVSGEQYPCRPEIFHLTYDEVLSPKETGSGLVQCGKCGLLTHYRGYDCPICSHPLA